MTTERKSWDSAETATWALFAVVVIAVYFFALDVPLLGPDEPRYSQVAREMFERGDLVTPTLGGYNWFEKPALLYWLQITSYSIFGVSEFAARFGSAVFGLGTAAALFLLGKAVQRSEFRVQGSGRPAPSSKPGTLNPKPPSMLGVYFALIAATSLGLMAFSRGASFDVIITFPVTASLVAYFIFEKRSGSSPATRYLSLSAFYFFIGVGLIAKGLIGIVFPIAIVGFYHLLSRRWPRKDLVLSLIWGTALSIAVAGLWYLPMILRHGWEFIDEFFVQHHFQRYTSNKYRHPGPFWYFWVILPAMTIPWLPFFLVSLKKYLGRVLFRRPGMPAPDFVSRYPDLLRFAVGWLLVPLVFFSVSGSKLPGYILPALPPAAIFAGLYINDFATGSRLRGAIIKLNAFAMLLVVTLILSFALPHFAGMDSTKRMIETADAAGFGTARILNMHTISHNAEYYGADRLIREPDGRQWKFLGVAGVVDYMKKNGNRPVLVLIPHQFESQLTESQIVEARVLERDSELSIVSVKVRGEGWAP